MKIKALSYWRIVAAPDLASVVGQGAAPSGPAVTLPGADGAAHELRLTWGQVVRASATCDPDRDLATLDATPVPLVRLAVVRRLLADGLVEPISSS